MTGWWFGTFSILFFRILGIWLVGGLEHEFYFSVYWEYDWLVVWNMNFIFSVYWEYDWLVVWNMNFIFPYIGNVMIPTGCRVRLANILENVGHVKEIYVFYFSIYWG